MATQAESIKLRVDGIDLNVLLDGDPENPAAVFVHGGGLSAQTWRGVIAELRRDFYCVAFDMRGHGDSGWSETADYSLASLASDLHAVMDLLELQRPHLIGMSLGGQTALAAIAGGLTVRSLVLVDVGPRMLSSDDNPIRDFMRAHTYPTFADALDAASAFQPGRSRESVTESLYRSMRQDADGSWSWKWDPRRRESYAQRAAEAQALWPRLGSVTCPVLVVRGLRSPVFTRELAAELVAELPDAASAAIGAGHNVQSERPAELAALIRDFQQSLRSSTH